MTGGEAMTGELRYSVQSLRLDALRAAGGLLASLLMAALVPLFGWVSWICLGLVLLFALYAVRTALRAKTAYRLGPDGLERMGWRPCQVKWADLRGLKLRYYSTQRNRENGWFQLQLETDSERIKLDTNLADFKKILQAAHGAAEMNKIEPDMATRENLIALGVLTRS